MALDSSRLSKNIQTKLEKITKSKVLDPASIDAICQCIVEELQANLEATEVDINLGGITNLGLFAIPTSFGTPSIVKGQTKLGKIKPGKMK